MSRVVKGGAKFKPVARPKPARPTATPTPAPDSQPVSSSQDVPSSSQVPELSQSSTQASSFPSSFPATPSSTQPSSSLPPPKPSSTSAASVEPSSQASSSAQPIPLPPARAYNPYLHDAAPPPIIVREPVRSSQSGASSSQDASSRAQGGRGPPTIASTPEPSQVRAGSSVPTIRATSGGPPPSPGGDGPSSRARAPPSIASTPAAAVPTPPALAPASPVRAARPPAIAATSDSAAMLPPATIPNGKGKAAPKVASARALHPPAPAVTETEEPVASTSVIPAVAPPPAPPPAPRGRGRGVKKSVLDLPTQPAIAPPVSAERGAPGGDDQDDEEPESPAAATLPLGSRSVRRNAPAAVASGRGAKRGAAAGVVAPAAKRARGKRGAVMDDEIDDAAEEEGVARVGDEPGEEGGAEAVEGEGTVAKGKGKGKASLIKTRPPPKLKAVPKKKKKVVDSDDEERDQLDLISGGDDYEDDAPAAKPKRKYVRKPKDPNAPPPKKRQPVEKDIDGNVISRASRKPSKRKKPEIGSDGEEIPAKPPRAPKPPMQGPLNEAGDPIPRPRVRKPRAPGQSSGRRRNWPDPILELADVEAHNAAVGDGPDASTTTMKDMCEDTGMGRISSRYIEIQRKAIDIKAARKTARLRMKARLNKAKNPGENDSEDDEGPLTLNEGGNAANGAYVRPEHAAGSAAALDALAEQAKAAKRAANEAAGIENPPDDEDDEDIDGVAEGAYAPQFRLVNGEMVLDQESLVADRHKETEERGEAEMEVLEERDTDRFINSTTWGKKMRGERWSTAETDLFYDAINQFGTDFEMIARLFPGRTRKMIKNKWNREEVINATRVTNALMHKVPVDMATYSRLTRTDLSGEPPVFEAPPPPPPRPVTPGGGGGAASAGPAKPKRKRFNPHDGEEVVGMVGADGEVVRADGYEEEKEEEVRKSVNAPSWARG